jgi:hypothetical protein
MGGTASKVADEDVIDDAGAPIPGPTASLLELTQAVRLGTQNHEIVAFTAGVRDETAAAMEGAHETSAFVASVRETAAAMEGYVRQWQRRWRGHVRQRQHGQRTQPRLGSCVKGVKGEKLLELSVMLPDEVKLVGYPSQTVAWGCGVGGVRRRSRWCGAREHARTSTVVVSPHQTEGQGLIHHSGALRG